MKRTPNTSLDRRGGSSLLRRLFAHPLECTLALVLASTPLGGAFANPLGGQVAAGSATIQGQGTHTVTVTQSSQSTIINWNTFNIGHGELTQFIQPNANAVALNRVPPGHGASQIYGTIQANGKIFLVNPDGILFGMGSRVDAAGFLATTNNIRDADFMAGHYNFNIPGRLDASIVNLGRINATNGGFAALVAPGVRNNGVITANLGHVALASGNGFTLDFYGDKLITLQVGDQVANQVIDVATGHTLSSLVSNNGTLRANGGTVSLTAVAARHVVDSVINNSGVIEANSVGTKNGMIVLGAATAANKPAHAPTQKVAVSGTLSVAGTRDGQKGGTVVIKGESVTLRRAKINGSGPAGGGAAHISGDDITVARGGLIGTGLDQLTLSSSKDIDVSAPIVVTGGGALTLRADNTGTGIGTVHFYEGGSVWTRGDVSIFYNPWSPKGASHTEVNAQSYTTPTDYGRYVHGDGQLTAYMLVNTVYDLQNIQNNLSGTYALGRSIDASVTAGWNEGQGFVPIGALVNGFAGSLNGQGHTINGLTIAPTFGAFTGAIGLFGVNRGTISNLHLTDVSIKVDPALPAQEVGALAGLNIGTIDNVTASGVIDGQNATSGALVGGLVGNNSVIIFSGDGRSSVTPGVIRDSSANVAITLGNGCSDGAACIGTVSFAGGLAGNNSGTILNSSAAGNVIVTGANSGAGGLVGANSSEICCGEGAGEIFTGRIFNSFATGNVSSPASDVALGGLVGVNRSGAVIWNSRATGTVTSTATVTSTIGPPSADCLLSSTCQFAMAGGLVGANLGSIEGRRLPLSEGSGCRGGFTCASGSVNGGPGGVAGGLVGWNSGVIFNAFAVGGTVHVGTQGIAGGLAGLNTGAIWRSFAAVNVTGDAGQGSAKDSSSNPTYLGGLVGDNQGHIGFSYATGDVGSIDVGRLEVGGLVAHNGGVIRYSAATGDVRAGQFSLAGGLVGQNNTPTQTCSECAPSPATISHSAATGDVAVGSNSVAGGLVAVNRGTIRRSSAGGAVRGAEDSILGGLAGVNDLAGLIGRSFAWGSVTGTGSNSVVAGLVGLNGGDIRDSRSNAPVSAADNSYVGGSVGINIGTVVDTQVQDGSVVVSGTGNLVGGFVGANMGLIDPSTTDAIPQAGAGNIVGNFAGANLTFDPAVFSGLTVPPPSFPSGSISSDSVNTNTASNSSPSTGTTTASSNPSTPGVINSCTDAICQIFQTGFLTPSQPPQPPQPPPSESTNSPLDTPPTPQQVLAPPSFTDNVNQPIVVNLTTEGTGANGNGGNGNGNGGNGNGNRNNAGANGAPTSPGPPPGPGIGRTLDEQRFSGVPPIGETRFLKGELVVQVSNTVPMSTVLQIAKELGITLISSQNVDVNGRVIYRFKAVSGRDIRILIRALEKKNVIASAQPNYTFRLSQSAPTPAAPATVAPAERTDIPPTTQPPSEPDLANANTAALESLPAGDSAQYVIDKMHLVQIHGLARGRGVVVAVIDSEIDANHPDLKGVIVDRFDATQSASHPHPHGTGMAGAIAAHRRLLGVAPGVRLIAIKAFDEQAASAEATSFQILKGLDYAIAHKARIINMSFAGPHDPMMERTLKLAHDKGIILVAAAGNAGPKSPPLYPGADKNVIAVTASDYNDRPFAMANRGRYIAVAAPGVDVMVPAPGNTYQLTTGTSVATAHVSGVAALMVERKPTITPDEVRAILMRTATPYSARPKGEEDGAGLVDPIAALKALGPAQAAQAAPRPAAPTMH